MVYFKMDMNPCRGLKTDKDYSDWARGCYRQATAFSNVALKCSDLLVGDNLITVYTNISFACELYFKCLLFQSKIDCRKEHNLYKLYCKLPCEIKRQLKELHPCGNKTKNCFEHELENLGQAFIVFRYEYEKKGMAWRFL